MHVVYILDICFSKEAARPQDRSEPIGAEPSRAEHTKRRRKIQVRGALDCVV